MESVFGSLLELVESICQVIVYKDEDVIRVEFCVIIFFNMQLAQVIHDCKLRSQ